MRLAHCPPLGRDADEVPETSQPAAAPTSSAAKPGLRWWLGVILFVAGVLVGVLGVGLLNATTPDFGAGATDGGAPVTASPQPGGASSVPVAAEARVNAACLRVINEAQDVSGVLSEMGEAVTDVDLQHLDELVRRLQPIQPRLERDLAACEVDQAGVRTPTATPAPQPTPAVSPTR